MASYSVCKQQDNNEKSIVLCQLLEMFDSIIDKSVIETVAESCNYTIQECIDTLINCVENSEVCSVYQKKPNNFIDNSISSSNNPVLDSNMSEVSKDQKPNQNIGMEKRQDSPKHESNETDGAFWYTQSNLSYSNTAKMSKPTNNAIQDSPLNIQSSNFNFYPSNERRFLTDDAPVRDCENIKYKSADNTLKHSMSFPATLKDEKKNEYYDSVTFSLVENLIRLDKKVFVILRGLPGSGKSSLAKSIIRRAYKDYDPSEFIFSTDDLFMDAWGMYNYDSSKLDEYHKKNQDRVLKAARKGVSPIIVDNTNTQLWEMMPYIKIAASYGYSLHFLEPKTPWAWNINELTKRNVHSVPRLLIQRMADRYEHNLNPTACLKNIKCNKDNKTSEYRSYPPLDIKKTELAFEIPQFETEDEKPKPQRIRNSVFGVNSALNSSEPNLIDLDFNDGKEVKSNNLMSTFEVLKSDEISTAKNTSQEDKDNIKLKEKNSHKKEDQRNEMTEDLNSCQNPREKLSTLSNDREMFDLVSKMKSFLNEKGDEMSMVNNDVTLPMNYEEGSNIACCLEQSDKQQKAISKLPDMGLGEANEIDELDDAETFVVESANMSMMKRQFKQFDDELFEKKCNNLFDDEIFAEESLSSYKVNSQFDSCNNTNIDNINSISWKESPFPVSDLLLPQKVDNVHKNVPLIDNSTNTCADDFRILYNHKSSLNVQYKVMKTHSRNINDGYTLLNAEEIPQSKLMLHKSSMTDDIEAPYGDTFLKNDQDDCNKKCMEALVEMFPEISKEYIYIVYANACNYDFNCATEILLDGAPQETLKDRMKNISKLDFINLDSSAESKGKPISRKREKDEEAIALQKYLEEKVQHKEASYHPHILRVKRWKQREPDMDQEEIKMQALNENAIEFNDIKPLINDSESNDNDNDIDNDNDNDNGNDESDQESTLSKSSSSNSSSDEMVEIKVGKEFIEDLERQFGNPDFEFPDGIFPVIQMKRSKAQEMYALWLGSMQQQQKVHQALLDEMIENDEEYARLIEKQQEDVPDVDSKLIVQEVNQNIHFDGFSCLSKAEKKSYADKVRQEGLKEYNLSRESLTKAQEAYNNCDETAGRLHSQIAERHEKKSAYLYMVASGIFVTLSREQHNDATLDLHYLLVKEALEAVDIFLSYHIEKLKTRCENHVTIFIITGRGLNSNGKSRIKPAVCKLLRSKKIKYSEANAGCLKITLRKKNLIFLDS